MWSSFLRCHTTTRSVIVEMNWSIWFLLAGYGRSLHTSTVVIIFLYTTTPEFPSRKVLLAGGRGWWMINRQQFLPTCLVAAVACCFDFSDGTRCVCRAVPPDGWRGLARMLAFEWFFINNFSSATMVTAIDYKNMMIKLVVVLLFAYYSDYPIIRTRTGITRWSLHFTSL